MRTRSDSSISRQENGKLIDEAYGETVKARQTTPPPNPLRNGGGRGRCSTKAFRSYLFTANMGGPFFALVSAFRETAAEINVAQTAMALKAFDSRLPQLSHDPWGSHISSRLETASRSVHQAPSVLPPPR